MARIYDLLGVYGREVVHRSGVTRVGEVSVLHLPGLVDHALHPVSGLLVGSLVLLESSLSRPGRRLESRDSIAQRRSKGKN